MFRKWSTKVLKEYIIKGSVLDDERLKVPNRIFGKDYFDEILARIKDIHSSDSSRIKKIIKYIIIHFNTMTNFIIISSCGLLVHLIIYC